MHRQLIVQNGTKNETVTCVLGCVTFVLAAFW